MKIAPVASRILLGMILYAAGLSGFFLFPASLALLFVRRAQAVEAGHPILEGARS